MAYFDAVLFRAASSGTGDFVVSSAITGYRTPAGASVPNADTGSYRAFSDDLTQWENGTYTYNSGTSTVSRTVTSNSAGNTSKINFTTAPQVGFVQSAADLANASNLLTGTVNINRIGSSGTRNSSNFFRGDDAWVAVVDHGLVSVVVYTSTATVTIPAGATRGRFRMIGGSGGGGGVDSGGGNGLGGGGSGGIEKWLTGLTPSNTLAFTSGAAGTAGNTSGSAGGNGGSSTLASGTQSITTLTASGGGGGSGTVASNNPTGGTGTNGDLNVTGQDGGWVGSGNPTNGKNPGGHSAFGLSVGGNGGRNNAAATAGVAGTAGLLIVEWYY